MLLHHKFPQPPSKNTRKKRVFWRLITPKKKRNFLRESSTYAATFFGSIQSLPTAIRTTSITAQSANTSRTPIC